MGAIAAKAAEDIPAAKGITLLRSDYLPLISYSGVWPATTCPCARITRPLKSSMLLHDRAYHGARISIQEVQIHFQNRLACRHFSTLFHRASKAGRSAQRYRYPYGQRSPRLFPFPAERMVGVEDFHDSTGSRRDHGFVRWFHRHAVTDRFAGERFVRHLFKRNNVTCHRRNQRSDGHRVWHSLRFCNRRVSHWRVIR